MTKYLVVNVSATGGAIAFVDADSRTRACEKYAERFSVSDGFRRNGETFTLMCTEVESFSSQAYQIQAEVKLVETKAVKVVSLEPLV